MGTLSSFIDEHAGDPKLLPVYLNITSQLLAGLMLVHATKQLHRDIKPENILLSGEDIKNLVAKLGDFGLVRDNESKKSTFSHIGT